MSKVHSDAFERGKRDALVGYPPQEGLGRYLDGWNEGDRLLREERRQQGRCPECGQTLPRS